MSRCYQIFMEQKIEELYIDNIMKLLDGYKNDLGDFTIQNKGACIWVSYNNDAIDKTYYEEEINDIAIQYGINIKYNINIDLNSDDSSDELAFKFYEELIKINKNSVLMNQNGEYLLGPGGDKQYDFMGKRIGKFVNPRLLE